MLTLSALKLYSKTVTQSWSQISQPPSSCSFFNCNSAGCHRPHPAAKQSARKTSDPVQTPDSASNVAHTFQGNDVFWEDLTVRAELYGIHRPQHTKSSFNINTRWVRSDLKLHVYNSFCHVAFPSVRVGAFELSVNGCFNISTTFPEAFLLNPITVFCDQILAYMQDIKGQETPFILWNTSSKSTGVFKKHPIIGVLLYFFILYGTLHHF